jgi:hypothetical protein
MLSVAKHLYHDNRDPSVATNAPSHRPDVLREDDITERSSATSTFNKITIY